MQLTKEDQERINSWIRDKCGSIRCFCCGTTTNHLTIIPFSTVSVGYNIHTTRFHYHEGIPQIGLACTNCGHIMYFNSAIMGFTPDEPAISPTEKEQANHE